MTTIETRIPMQHELGEGPLWHQDALYWVEIITGQAYRHDFKTGQQDTWQVTKPLGGIFPCTDGKRWLVLAGDGFIFWEPEHGTIQEIAMPEAERGSRSRFNDGAIDARGRFWSGTFDDDGQGTLYRLDPDLSLHAMDTGYHISNGIGWNLDNTVMYATDSPTHSIYAFDYDLATGSISNKRPFVTLDDDKHFPDGLKVDSAGYVWSAGYGSWHLWRFAPDGSLDRKIELPVERPTSLCFGGDDLKTIFVTSAWEHMDAEARAAQPLAGNIFSLQVDVAGQPTRLFDPQS